MHLLRQVHQQLSVRSDLRNSQVFDVLQRLREGEKMVAVVAPAILGQYNAPTEKVYGAIKAIGFEDVIEVAQGAMETIRNEGAELEEKLRRDRRS